MVYYVASNWQHSFNINLQIISEYNDLLTSQLENQKIVSSYFHSLVSVLHPTSMPTNLVALGVPGIGFFHNCMYTMIFLWAYTVKIFGYLLFFLLF